MKITIETTVNAGLNEVWNAFNSPAEIKQWNSPGGDWHTTRSEVDLREGGKFLARMEAKDGSAGFDFEGVYSRVEPQKAIEYRIGDGREVQVEFVPTSDGVKVTETFDAETQNTPEFQRQGWQAILDNFKQHVEASNI